MLLLLRKQWNLGKKEWLLILCVFATSGFAIAWLSKSITAWMGFTPETHRAAKPILRLRAQVFGYQVILLAMAFLIGQFSFFGKFEKSLLQRISLPKGSSPSSKL